MRSLRSGSYWAADTIDGALIIDVAQTPATACPSQRRRDIEGVLA